VSHRDRWRLPLRLIAWDRRRALLVSAVTAATLLAALLVTGYVGEVEGRRSRETPLLLGDVMVDRFGGRPALSAAPFAPDLQLTTIDAGKAADAFVGFDVSPYLRLYAHAFVVIDGLVTQAMVIGVDDDDPLSAVGGVPVEGGAEILFPVAMGNGDSWLARPAPERIGAWWYRGTADGAGSTARGVTDGLAIVTDRELLSREIGWQEPVATAVTVFRGRTARTSPAQTSFALAYEANLQLGDSGLLATPWQEIVGPEVYAVTRHAGRAATGLALVVAVAALAGSAAASMQERKATILTLRLYGFRPDTLRGAFVREAAVLASIGTAVALLVFAAVSRGLQWSGLDGQAAARFAVAGILVPPLVTFLSTRRTAAMPLASLGREEAL